MASELHEDGNFSDAAQRQKEAGRVREQEQDASLSGYERDYVGLNLGGERLLDVSGVSGADSVTDGRGLVVADFDNDGDMDLFLRSADTSEAHLLFRNNVGQAKRFVRIALEGRASGRDAFGAEVRVRTSQGTQTQLKSSAGGYLAQPDGRLLFGLGEDEATGPVEVRWPSGLVQSVERLDAGASVRWVEGEAPVAVDEVRFTLPDPRDPSAEALATLAMGKGESLADVRVWNTEGRDTQTLGEAIAGKATLVNVWATWCGPCRHEMPELQALHEAGTVQVIGVGLDAVHELSKVRAIARDLGVTYPLHPSTSPVAAGLLAAPAVPTSILVDAEGRVIDAFVGGAPATRARMRAAIAALP